MRFNRRMAESAFWVEANPAAFSWWRTAICFTKMFPFEWIDRVFEVMAACPAARTFQVFTKRPERMRGFSERCLRTSEGVVQKPATERLAGNQRRGSEDSRRAHSAPAGDPREPCAGVSAEPLLAPIDLYPYFRKAVPATQAIGVASNHWS